jgi:hypothetical protein
MSDLRVVELPVNNLMDVPLMLRNLADTVEQNPEIAVRIVAVIQDDHGDTHCRGYGDAGDITRMIGLLEEAKHGLLCMDKPGR